MFSVSEKASEMIKEFLKNRTEAAFHPGPDAGGRLIGALSGHGSG